MMNITVCVMNCWILGWKNRGISDYVSVGGE